MSKTIAERVKVCQKCKHFIFKDDTVSFCSSCFCDIEPDIDIEIVEAIPESTQPTIFSYVLGWLFK